MNPQRAWETAYHQLEIQLDPASFNTWVRNTTFLSYEGNVFTIGAANAYACEMLQGRFYRSIQRLVSDAYGHPVELRFVLHTPSVEDTEPDELPLLKLLQQKERMPDLPPSPLHRQVERPEYRELTGLPLKPEMTFERFIANQANKLAYQAALSVAESPATAYNPLFIYGDTGLGKTHLLTAIAHKCHQQGLRVIYTTGEAFTNDLIEAIRNRTNAMFRERYRSADVLLVDDIQFIKGKQSTQEEFFHTFNALVQFNRQVVLSSDKHPSEIAALEDRLRTRFQGGLVVDLQPPELETRVAILQMWARESGVSFSQDVLYMIAESAPASIRELRGYFLQMEAKAKLNPTGFTRDSAQFVVETYRRPRQQVTPKLVIEATARVYGLQPEDLTSKRRSRQINLARQVAMYLAREITHTTLSHIGFLFDRTHSTVFHSCKKITEALADDEILRLRVEKIRRTIHEMVE